MLIVQGNKTAHINQTALNELIAVYANVEIDLGTGDGRFVYKKALLDKKTFYIGVDSAEKQLVEFSKKAIRKKLKNILFVVGSFEQIPAELKNSADKLYIILPWGSLLKSVADPNQQNIDKLTFLLKPRSELEIVFGYDSQFEPTETSRLELGTITPDTIKSQIIPAFESNGFTLKTFANVSTTQLKQLESTWAKRISQREDRNIYLLAFARYN